MLHYHFRDPVPFVFQRRRVFDDRDVCVRPGQMHDYEPQAGGAMAGFAGDLAYGTHAGMIGA
jgi:hypothetical protein